MELHESSLATLRALDLAVPLPPGGAGQYSPLDLAGPGSALAGVLPLVRHAADVMERFATHHRQVVRALEGEQVRLQRQEREEWDRMFQLLVARAEACGLALDPCQQDVVDGIARLAEEWATRVRTVGDGDLCAMQDTYRAYAVGYAGTLEFAAKVAERLSGACRAVLTARAPELLLDAPWPDEADGLGWLEPVAAAPGAREADPVLAEQADRLGVPLGVVADPGLRASAAAHGRHALPDLLLGPGLGPDRARRLADALGVHPWWLQTMHPAVRDGDGCPLGSGGRPGVRVPDPLRGAPRRSLVGAVRVPVVGGRDEHLPGVWWALRQAADAVGRRPPPLLPGYELLRRAGADPEAELDTDAGRRGLCVAARRVAALLDAAEARPVRDLLCALYPENEAWWHGRGPAGCEWQRAWPPCFTGWLSAAFRCVTAATSGPPVPDEEPVWCEVPRSALVFARPDPPPDWQRGWLPAELRLSARFPPETHAGELRTAWVRQRLGVGAVE